MERRSYKLVFEPTECQTLMDVVGIFLINHAEELETDEAYSLHHLRAKAMGRLLAQQHDLFELGGMFYQERKKALIKQFDTDEISVVDDDVQAMRDLTAEALLTLPGDAEDAQTLAVPYTVLLQDCIRTTSYDIDGVMSQVEHTIGSESQEEAAIAMEGLALQVTGWAYQLGLREVDASSLLGDTC